MLWNWSYVLGFDAENSQSYKIQCGKVRRCRALAPKNPPWKITSYMDRRRVFRRTTFLDSLYAVVTQIMITMTSFPKCKQPDGPGLMLRCPHFVYLWNIFLQWKQLNSLSWCELVHTESILLHQRISFHNMNSWMVFISNFQQLFPLSKEINQCSSIEWMWTQFTIHTKHVQY